MNQMFSEIYEYLIRLGLGLWVLLEFWYMLYTFNYICISLGLDACTVLSGKNSSSEWTSPLNATSSVMEFWQ